MLLGRIHVHLGVNENFSPLGKTALSKVRETPLSNATMARKADIIIATDLQDQLVAKKTLVVKHCDSHIRDMFKQCYGTKIWAKAFTE